MNFVQVFTYLLSLPVSGEQTDILPYVIGGGLLLGAILLIVLKNRRKNNDEHDDQSDLK